MVWRHVEEGMPEGIQREGNGAHEFDTALRVCMCVCVCVRVVCGVFKA